MSDTGTILANDYFQRSITAAGDSFWLACHPAVAEHAMVAVLNVTGTTAPVHIGVDLGPCSRIFGMRSKIIEYGQLLARLSIWSLVQKGGAAGLPDYAARQRRTMRDARSPQLVRMPQRPDRSSGGSWRQKSINRAEEDEPCASATDAHIYRARSSQSISAAAIS